MSGMEKGIGGSCRRQARRLSFVSSAKVYGPEFNVDAHLTNLSATGVRIICNSYVRFPEEVTIELKSGEKWRVSRRWQSGLKAGFAFLTP